MLVFVITKLLLDGDTFETGEMAARARSREWAMRAGAGGGAGTCAGCQQPLMPLKQHGVSDGVRVLLPLRVWVSSGKDRSKGRESVW
jgi:hypothetical protein